jgi:hypothetical protein
MNSYAKVFSSLREGLWAAGATALVNIMLFAALGQLLVGSATLVQAGVPV